MADYWVQDTSLSAIGDAVRAKTGLEGSMTLSGMVSAIESIKEDKTKAIIERTIAGSYSNDVVTTISNYAFYSCLSLATVSFPAATSIGNYAFYSCRSLASVSFPVATTIGSSAFYGCSSLTSVSFPAATSIGSYAFRYCSSLATVSFPAATSIGNYAFYGCSGLTKLYLGGSSTTTLANANAFYSTPMSLSTYTGSFGSIYVPASLFASYRVATNWATYADRITPLGIVTDPIKCRPLTFGQSKQMTLFIYGVEGDVTYNVTSSNENVATISDVAVTNESITFNINTLQIEGESIIKVEITCGDEYCSTEGTLAVYETLPEATWEVQSVDGASYGFGLNEDGYYESTNQGVNSSAAVCKLVFDTKGIYTLYLDCINYAENNYDYGLISQLDTTLSTWNSADSSGVLKNFRGASSASVQTVEIGDIEAGEHFVYIKFRKDSGGHSNNDSLQFKVRME